MLPSVAAIPMLFSARPDRTLTKIIKVTIAVIGADMAVYADDPEWFVCRQIDLTNPALKPSILFLGVIGDDEVSPEGPSERVDVYGITDLKWWHPVWYDNKHLLTISPLDRDPEQETLGRLTLDDRAMIIQEVKKTRLLDV